MCVSVAYACVYTCVCVNSMLVYVYAFMYMYVVCMWYVCCVYVVYVYMFECVEAWVMEWYKDDSDRRLFTDRKQPAATTQ